MQKILGLDIGSYSIKAVEIVNTFQDYQVEAFHEVVIPEIEGLDTMEVGTTALRQLFTERQIQADRIFTGMMGLMVSTRFANYPNVKKRDLAHIIEGEITSSFPATFGDVVVDSQVLEQKNNTWHVMTLVCKRENVEALLSNLKAIKVDPKVVDADYISYLNLLGYIDTGAGFSADESTRVRRAKEQEKARHRLIIDIGHAKTSLLLVHGEKPVAVRTFAIAGRYFTEHLQKTLHISYDEAQRVKHKVNRMDVSGAPLVGDDKEGLVARRLGSAVQDWCREILRTLHAFKSNEKVVPEQIYITGGSSVIEGLPHYLESVIGIPVQRLQYNTHLIKTQDEAIARSPVVAQALALALRGIPSKSNSTFNLRKGELALVDSYDGVINQITKITSLFASIVLALCLSYLLRSLLYGRQDDNLKRDFRAEVISLLGQEPRTLKNISTVPGWDLAAYSSQAFRLIGDETKNRETLLTGISVRKSVLPLRVIDEISKNIPKDLYFEILDFSMQGNNVSISFDTKSLQESDKILGILKGLSLFQSVDRKSQDPKPGSDGKLQTVKIQALLK